MFYLLIASIVSLEAQAPLFKYIRESEGLNSNRQWSRNVLHIDQHGFLWIATTKGLNRYDGETIKTFNGIMGGLHDIPYKMISAICGDHKDNIWLGTQEEGLIKYNSRLETFEVFKSEDYLRDSLAFGQINNLSLTKAGDIIICTAFQGVFKYYTQIDSLVYIDIDHPSYFKGANNQRMLKNDQLAILSFNGIFIGNHDKNNNWQYYPVDKSIFLSDAHELPNGHLEVFAQNRIDHFIIDPLKKEIKSFKNPMEKQTCNFYIGQDHIKWTTAYDGVIASIDIGTEELKTFKAFTDIEGTSLNICPVDMIGDAYGNIYYMSVGTGAGQIVTDYPFEFLEGTNTGIIRIIDNEIYVAQGGKLFKYQEDQLKLISLKTDLNAYITNFEVGQDGNIWIIRGGANSLSYFDPNGNQIGPNYKAIWYTQIQDMGNGRLTVGHNFDKDENLPFHFSGDIYEKLSGKEYPGFKSKFHIKTQLGEIWIATAADGVIRVYDNLSKYEFLNNDEEENSLNSNNPYYIYESKAGLIYVCTDQGINIWDPKKETFSYLNNYDVGFFLDVKGMTEDGQGNLWVLLKNEVVKLDVNTKEFYSYKVHPQFKYFRFESQDLQIDENGNIYYEGQFGIVKFDPKKLETQRAPNPILFTDLYVNRKRVFPKDAHQLIDSSLFYQSSFVAPYNLRDVGFSFVSPHGSDVNAQYFYRLKGYKEEWQMAPSNKTIHFTSLEPGKYSLEVKAKSGAGKWTQEIANIDFKIKAPWYQTWWAFLIYFCSISFLAYAFYRYRINQLLKYQSLRTKISSDLHDDVGSILGSIAMESEMLSYDKSTSLTEELARLSELSREAMSRMRDTVWAIDSRKDKVGFLSDRMKDYLNATLNNSKFDGKFILNDDHSSHKITPDVRQNVYLIFKEALTNAIKHSSGDTITITFSRVSKKYILSIHDNGKSPTTMSKSGLGMSNMEMRAKLIGAKLEINKSEGFEVKLIF